MNRYNRVFSSLRGRGEIAFIPFAVAGDPDIRVSEAVFKTYIDSGADILEIGYPFSDPIADGPVNQRAALRALRAGLTHDKFFSLIGRLRRYSDIPMGLLAYANSLYHLGYERFCARAADAGLDSILIADMPPEEAGEFCAAMRRHGLQTVFIVSELTPPARMKTICSRVSGFVYVVSRLGPTGVHKEVHSVVAGVLGRLRAVSRKPLCVGFGLSSPGHIRTVKKAGADGAIVGSALVKIVEAGCSHVPKMLSKLAQEVRAYKKATAG
jgi:tryptophan synthase alpha chain